MYRWIIAAAIIVGIPSLITLYLQRRRKQQQRVTVKTFANKLVSAAALRAPYRDAVEAHIVKTYGRKRQTPLRRRHPSFVLLYMAKHPCVQTHIRNTMKTSDTELERVPRINDARVGYADQNESANTFFALLKGKVMYYANLLMDGFDTFNMQELVIDRSGRLTAVRSTRFDYCPPINQQLPFYPANYTRLFDLSSPPKVPHEKNVATI